MTKITMLKHEYYIVNTSKNVKTQEKKNKDKKIRCRNRSILYI